MNDAHPWMVGLHFGAGATKKERKLFFTAVNNRTPATLPLRYGIN